MGEQDNLDLNFSFLVLLLNSSLQSYDIVIIILKICQIKGCLVKGTTVVCSRFELKVLSIDVDDISDEIAVINIGL